MAEQILMPRLSDTMTEGVIAAWHKKVGDTVKKGDLLAEVETDKATMDLESYKDGTLLYVGTDKGGKIQVNDLLAIIGSPGEDISSLKKHRALHPQKRITLQPRHPHNRKLKMRLLHRLRLQLPHNRKPKIHLLLRWPHRPSTYRRPKVLS